MQKFEEAQKATSVNLNETSKMISNPEQTIKDKTYGETDNTINKNDIELAITDLANKVDIPKPFIPDIPKPDIPKIEPQKSEEEKNNI